MDESTTRGVRYLVGLAPEGARRQICARLRIRPEGPVGPSSAERYQVHSLSYLVRTATPAVGIWMLQQDRPELNELLDRYGLLPWGVTEDLRSGLLFGPGRDGPAPEGQVLTRHSELGAPAAVIDRLRQATHGRSLRAAKTAARQLRRADWPLVVAAHQEQPLPGYARWALAEQIDCPPELRAAFGTHAKFDHRLRQAGVLGGPADLLGRSGPVLETLRLLGAGRTLFPTRLAEAEAILQPLVERELGGHGEAWAVLAQLLPGFTGTLPRLVTTAGAIAGPVPEHEPEYEELPEPEPEPALVAPRRPPVVRASVRRKVPAPAPVEPEAEPTAWQMLGDLVRRITGRS
ncbi:hypothetical protein ACIRPK_23305 [Kitasatospora sp. NPDC101801]|uniref:hypothetical protein n=1 Tax=Kitasatospora sp. NPDC101801 TaxID=3364103 RepID=UPI00380535F1